MINNLLRQLAVRVQLRDRDAGVTAVEYALILALMVVIVVAAFATLGPAIADAFNDAAGAIDD